MKKNWKGILLIGVVLAEVLAVGFDMVFNEGRIVQPVDLDTYVFRGTDLPLIAATAALVCCVLFLMIRSLVINFRNGGTAEKGVTRKLSPKFGWLGFFGFFGFLGIPSYIIQGQVWPFFFFVFFGFFGFFYEAKMSCTLMDERFKEEQSRAQLVSYKTGFGLLWAVAWFVGLTGGRIGIDHVALIFSVASSLIIGLVLFLNSSLLYKYDTEEAE